ncbi:nitrous oxide-stimulated promoter family protein [Desulfosporosinus sp. Sb-LF]|uniref:nitrous oxide-stimulated promoter family protein n=1 Tax=Desulfosporosinus sp. Sb-LF TaxID=2560027 RepID=UPI00107F04B3|nr:nitrous oxide-stimulated promoter family protein [Desulfosporosinus sp. Sb-LF]TGE31527.1 nitrous oxide-stimulated promoter family protein [Desulfosporosinus sp. Sb-LF]
MSNRLEREKTTVQMMLRLYCKNHHHTADGLCSECQGLSDYAMTRLAHCKFGDRKPTCGKCIVHCYKPEMRMRIIEVMRYSGPKMLFVHPIASIRHLIDGRRNGHR